MSIHENERWNDLFLVDNSGQKIIHLEYTEGCEIKECKERMVDWLSVLSFTEKSKVYIGVRPDGKITLI
jgi:hypothetical protein